MTTRIEKPMGSYNERRYSKPWIAVVDFSKAVNGEFRWGNWVGDAHGGSGLLVMDVEDGDIVAIGQKDFRQPRNSVPTWYQVVEGKLVKLSGKAEAYKIRRNQ
jgi:hypothetical protein